MLSLLLIGGCSSAPALMERPKAAGEATFEALALLALSDIDMAGTAYADGILKPLPGQADTLSAIVPARSDIPASSVPVSNSVMGWPGSMDVGSDGRFAYVAEIRAAAPTSVEKLADGVFEGMPRGSRVTRVDVRDPANLRILDHIELPGPPTSIHIAPNGRFALLSTNDATAPLVAVALDDGALGQLVALPFTHRIPASKPSDAGAMFVRIAPNGRDIALNLANTHVQFARLQLKSDGLPAGIEPLGEPIAVGKWISMLRWSNDSRHLLVADVAWGQSQLGAATNGPGQIIAIRPRESGQHPIVATAEVSLSPEGFEMNRAGDLIVAVNMERTYLPDAMPFSLFGRREAASLSLLTFDSDTGALRVVDGPLAFKGVLPEDAVFDDRDGMVAVAVFHDREERPQQGWIEWFAIDRTSGKPVLTPTGRRTALPRGVHDLIVLPRGAK
jgi:hypothetical protein